MAKLQERFVNAILRTFYKIALKVNFDEFNKVPLKGPFIIIANHTSALDGPMMYVFMQPRKMVALAKKELWDNSSTRYLMNLWESIPVDRENMERKSVQRCFEILDQNNILAIAPEGTRSKDGRLQEGKEGVAFIAFKKQVPMIPIATIGMEKIIPNLKKLKRTEVKVVIGEPFEIIQKEGRLNAENRKQLIDEIMGRLVALLPPELHGYYADKQIDFTLTQKISL
ncbi:MAG: lysophospholipid acyltransferase family protein [Sphaerochaetaceae bacterium]